MDSLIAHQPGFGELDISYPIQGPHVSQQVYELYDDHMELDNLSSQPLPTDGQDTTGYSSVLHSLHPSSALHTDTPYNAEFVGGTQTVPVVPINPPTKLRKKKAPTLRAGDWEPYKPRIIELHIAKKLPLREVQKKLEEEFSFTAEYVFPSR